MHDPWNHIEYDKAELPDGRLLLIERERAPRLGRRGQIFLEIGFAVAMIYLIPQLMQVTYVFGDYWLWAFIAFAIAYVALSFILFEKLTAWASAPPDDPAGCKVVGMDLSTDELVSMMRGEPLVDAGQWSIH
jgi:hypothetical protein